MTQAANLSALGSNITTSGNLSSASTLTLQTNSTTAMTIDTSQKVGIGSTSPSAKLEIAAPNISGRGQLSINANNGASDTAQITLYNGTNEWGQMYCNSTNMVIGSVDYLPLNIRSAGTTAMWIDNSQNVGIGNTSPYAKLQAYQSSNTLPVSWIYRGTQAGTTLPTTFGTPYLQIGASEYANSGVAIQTIGFGYVSGNGNAPPAEIGLATTSTAGQTYGDLVFATRNVYTNTAATERMRIDSSGVLLVGTTSYNSSVSATCKFQVQNNGGDWAGAFQNNSSSSTAYGVYVRYLNLAPNNTGSEFLYCNDSGALRATIRSNGGLANYSANNASLSDAREKTNIELASNYLDKICAIPVKTFNYIDQNMEDDPGLTLGVIAQDVQEVAPELVMESNWANKDEPEKLRLSIYQTDLQYALMKSIQELKAIVDAQQKRIETLEGTK